MIAMRLSLRPFLFAALACGAACAQAQSAPAPAAAGKPDPGDELRRLCATVSMHPADAREMARRAECILAGVLPAPDRIGEARMLARAAYKAGEPSGGLMLYLVYLRDPAYQAVRDGKVDPQAYKRLAARSGFERTEQIEALEGLGFAAGKNHAAAGMLLANYFHDTVAPRNVSRTGAIAALLMRNGEKNEIVDRFAREADVIARTGPTKASARAFLEAYRGAAATATAAYQEQKGGQVCASVELKSLSAGEIEGPAYLPLKGALVAGSYLVRGTWSEFWNFQACGEEVPVKVTFQADGWGGATSTATHNKGG
jgi:hypothetical protein